MTWRGRYLRRLSVCSRLLRKATSSDADGSGTPSMTRDRGTAPAAHKPASPDSALPGSTLASLDEAACLPVPPSRLCCSWWCLFS
uniref:Putative secreted protein n=1 Tax=Ixodes ricinus TaxID=34613 RepID=A0A6B0U724_IXORI